MWKRLVLFCLALTIISAGVLPSVANAITGSDFQAGRIIDDGVFFNGNDMGVATIQNFLNSKVPTCDTNGTQIYSGSTTRAQYSASKGHYPPFTCLKDYSQSTPSKAAESGLCNAYGGGTKSSAQIIYDIAQSCGVSPKVLIVLLEKEQSLVTDSWPWDTQYRSATGYGCPDTAPCDADYYGFFNQVYNAARQFKRYGRDSNLFAYRAYRTVSIQYNPNASCGSSNVYLQNQATAGLYNYTPYQPNGAALNNLYGSGDACSAYGNRNFWRLYNDWFGSTFGGDRQNTAWNFETLDGTVQSINATAGQVGNYAYSLSVGSTLHTFYYDIAGGNLKHAWADANGWHFETVDGAGGANGQIDANVGGFTKALIYNNQLTVAYKDFQNGDLRLATQQSNGTWSIQTIDGAGGTNGRTNSDVGWDISAITSGGSLHLFYSDATKGNLRHAWTDANGWHFEDLDGDVNSIAGKDGNIGQGVKAEFIGNSIHMFYYDGTGGNLRHAWTDANGWHFEDLDGSPGSVSRFGSDLGSSPDYVWWHNSLHVYYHDVSRGTLRHAWTDANGWHFEDLDGSPGSVSRYSANVGIRTSILLNHDQLNVFYYDGTTHGIRQAYFDAGGWHFVNTDGTLNSASFTSAPLGEMLTTTMYGNEAQIFYFDANSQTLKHAWGPPL